MSRRHIGGLTVVLVAGVASLASAQGVAGPPGSVGGLFGGHQPPDPNRSTQRLDVSFDVSGGYDDNVEGLGVEGSAAAAGYASTADARVRYWRGRAARFFETSGRTFINHQTAVTETLVGGDALVRGGFELGRRNQMTAGLTVTYDPGFVGGISEFVVEDPSDTVDLPDLSVPQGIVEQRWLATAGAVTLQRSWTTRQIMDINFQATERRPIVGAGFDSSSQNASVVHTWNFRPNAGLLFSYSYDGTHQSDEGLDIPTLRTQQADAGIRMERRLSPIRTLMVTFTGGAAFTSRAGNETVGPLDFVEPTASGVLRVGLTRRWFLVAEGNRSVTALEGVTPEPFATDAATLRLEVVTSPRFNYSVGGTYTQGSVLGGDTGSFEATAFTAQMQYGIARCCGVFSNYTYYNHRLEDLSTLPEGFPARYDRHSIRVGLTVWLPLYGTF